MTPADNHSAGASERVEVSEQTHPSNLPTDDLLAECTIRRTRGTGPGGQRRNKVETGIEITHGPTGIVAAAGERRSAEENHRVAVRRLQLQLAVSVRTVASDVVNPSPLWASRCLNQRISCSVKHRDFPAMIAEAMNAVHAKGYDVRRAAAALGCSTSQLIRFLGRHPEALTRVNRERLQLGMKTLRS